MPANSKPLSLRVVFTFKENVMKMRFVFGILCLAAVIMACTVTNSAPKKPAPANYVAAYTAEWCEACKEIKPILDWLIANESEYVSIRVIDIDKDPAAAKEAGITSVPTFIVTFDGKITRTHDIQVVVGILHDDS
jgi:thiol-disulfide isomerase/thioredoxin